VGGFHNIMDLVFKKFSNNQILERWEEEVVNITRSIYKQISYSSKTINSKDYVYLLKYFKPDDTLGRFYGGGYIEQILKDFRMLNSVVHLKDSRLRKVSFLKERLMTKKFTLTGYIGDYYHDSYDYLTDSKVLIFNRDTKLIIMEVVETKYPFICEDGLDINTMGISNRLRLCDVKPVRVVIYKCKISNLLRFMGISTSNFKSVNENIVANYKNLALTEEGNIFEDDKKIGVVSSRGDKNIGQFLFLKSLMELHFLQKDKTKFIPGKEILHNMGVKKELKDLVYKINAKINQSSYIISRSREYYRIKEK